MNILIVEDESKTAELLREFIESEPDCLVVKILDSIATTVNFLQNHQSQIDLIFLDIQLADGQSFEIFQKIQVKTPVIFCTAYDDFLLQAFKNNGIDYILKPFEEQDIAKAIDKFKNLKDSFSKSFISTNKNIQSLAFIDKPPQKSFIVHFQDKMIPVLVDNIGLFYIANQIVYIHCFDNKKYPIFKSLDEIQSQLDDKLFFRINRQMIIHRRAVKEIEPYFNRKIIIKTPLAIPEEIIVSRLKVSAFLKWLEKPE